MSRWRISQATSATRSCCSARNTAIYIDIGAAFVNDMSTGFLQTEGSEEDWEQLIDSIADILGKGLSRD